MSSKGNNRNIGNKILYTGYMGGYIEHNIENKYGQVIYVNHAPEADLYIVNHIQPYDIVITRLGLSITGFSQRRTSPYPFRKVLHE